LYNSDEVLTCNKDPDYKKIEQNQKFNSNINSRKKLNRNCENNKSIFFLIIKIWLIFSEKKWRDKNMFTMQNAY